MWKNKHPTKFLQNFNSLAKFLIWSIFFVSCLFLSFALSRNFLRPNKTPLFVREAKCFIKSFANNHSNRSSHQNHRSRILCQSLFLIKLQAKAKACNFVKKETLAQVFSSKFCEISKNTFSHRTPPMAASPLSCARLLNLIDLNLNKLI